MGGHAAQPELLSSSPLTQILSVMSVTQDKLEEHNERLVLARKSVPNAVRCATCCERHPTNYWLVWWAIIAPIRRNSQYTLATPNFGCHDGVLGCLMGVLLPLVSQSGGKAHVH